jgi:hypothetical protein
VQADEKKLCRGCGDNKETGRFPTSPKMSKEASDIGSKGPCASKCHNKKVTADPFEKPPVFVLRVTRHRDRASGLENDLTREFVAEHLAKPCAYCGSTVVMGLRP